jgi:hypothetical protein
MLEAPICKYGFNLVINCSWKQKFQNVSKSEVNENKT